MRRARSQAAVKFRVDKVQVRRIRQLMAQPRRFARAAQAEQEAVSVRNLEKAADNFHFIAKYGINGSVILPYYRNLSR